MRKLLLGISVTLFGFVSSLQAQDRTVTGRVTADDGSTLPGVNILLKGTASGAVTDMDGKYSIALPASGGVLVFSYIGMMSQEIAVSTQSVLDVKLESDSKQLNEIVVTALGIKRETKSLPYASQQVNAEKLSITRANNINDALAGKVAGVQVRGQSGAALGRANAIRIRGAGSLNDKGPLYVVDGTPMADGTGATDLNPDDIESINVLKGPAATALYGQRGDAGVVIVTTKKGTKTKGAGISINQNLFVDKIYILPRYQNSYMGGAYADLQKFTWQNGMPAEWQSLDGKYYPDYTDDGSWGPRMVGQEYIPWYAWIPGTKYTGQTAKLVPQPSNVRDYYNTGMNRTTNVSFSKSEENYSVRISYTNQGVTGVNPYTSQYKNTVAAQTTLQLSKKLSVGTNINYVNQLLNGDFYDGYSNYSTGSFNQWFHRDIDMNIMKELADVRSPEGRSVSWNHFNPTSALSLGDKFYRGYYWWNPATYFKVIDYKNNRDRLFGDLNLTYKVNDHLSFKAYYRKNQVTSFYENKKPSILPYSFNVELRPTDQANYDYYGTGQTFQKEDNLEFLADYNNIFLDGKLSVELMAGGNIRKEAYKEFLASTVDGLVVQDLFTLSNSKKQPFATSNFRSTKEVRSIYARGSFGYSGMIYLDWSVRNDWSSALPASNNSYMYPSLGTSFVFSELTKDAIPFLSLGKLRASVAKVGSDLNPYQLALLYGVGSDQWNGNIVTGTPNELVDPKIQPALSSAKEAGMDLRFLRNRFGLSATYYQEDKRNEILSVPISGASGFTSKKINAGRIQRSGIELSLDGTVIKAGDFSWDLTLNWSRNRSKIIELVEGIDAVAQPGANDAFGLAYVYNVVGKPWGQLRGYGITRDDQGRPVLDDGGFYIPEQNKDLGSVLPNFIGGIINQMRYKNFGLSFNIDYQSGGKFFSLSDVNGTFSGLTQRTAGLNDKGIPVRDPVSEGGGVHVTGVNENGESVDTYVDAKLYYQQWLNSGIAENSIYDLTFIKLREVNLSYQIPVSKLGKLGNYLTNASFSLVGRNLWLIKSNVRDFDPSEISGTFGENGQFPGTRSYGFNLKLSF